MIVSLADLTPVQQACLPAHRDTASGTAVLLVTDYLAANGAPLSHLPASDTHLNVSIMVGLQPHGWSGQTGMHPRGQGLEDIHIRLDFADS